MKVIISLFLLGCLNFLSAQTAYEIVDKAENIIKGGETCKGKFTMIITTPEFERTLKMDAWWVGNDKSLIVVTAPAKESGNKTLKIGKEIWNYLKNTETTIKIPPSMMLASWNGSDLTNDDLVRESELVRDYDIKILFDERIDNELCWKIELTPKPNAPVVWGRIYYWVRKTDYLPSIIQFYDEKGSLQRTMVFSEIKAMSGRKIPTKWKIISNKKEKNFTEFIYDDVKFDVKISDRIFSFKELEK
jgi:outer membrane lipoprotein-sorting protein